MAPLFACLTSEIRHPAALIGSRMPGGLLDPLLLALNEVTKICSVPVPSWLADSGGKGIQIITVAHGEAQLRGRWGKDPSVGEPLSAALLQLMGQAERMAALDEREAAHYRETA